MTKVNRTTCQKIYKIINLKKVVAFIGNLIFSFEKIFLVNYENGKVKQSIYLEVCLKKNYRL